MGQYVAGLADSVKFVKSMDAGSACHAVPVVPAAFAPAVQPSLAHRGEGEGAEVAGFTTDAILISAQKSSFSRLTLKSFHRVKPSMLTVMSLRPCRKVRQKWSAYGVRCRRREPPCHHRCSGDLG